MKYSIKPSLNTPKLENGCMDYPVGQMGELLQACFPHIPFYGLIPAYELGVVDFNDDFAQGRSRIAVHATIENQLVGAGSLVHYNHPAVLGLKGYYGYKDGTLPQFRQQGIWNKIMEHRIDLMQQLGGKGIYYFTDFEEERLVKALKSVAIAKGWSISTPEIAGIYVNGVLNYSTNLFNFRAGELPYQGLMLEREYREGDLTNKMVADWGGLFLYAIGSNSLRLKVIEQVILRNYAAGHDILRAMIQNRSIGAIEFDSRSWTPSTGKWNINSLKNRKVQRVGIALLD